MTGYSIWDRIRSFEQDNTEGSVCDAHPEKALPFRMKRKQPETFCFFMSFIHPAGIVENPLHVQDTGGLDMTECLPCTKDRMKHIKDTWK